MRNAFATATAEPTRSADQFIAVKACWLLRREPGLKTGGLALLDYGCGAGDLMRVLAGLIGNAGARGSFTGCDVSTGMLAEVAKRWPPAWPCAGKGGNQPRPRAALEHRCYAAASM